MSIQRFEDIATVHLHIVVHTVPDSSSTSMQQPLIPAAILQPLTAYLAVAVPTEDGHIFTQIMFLKSIPHTLFQLSLHQHCKVHQKY